VTLNLEEDTEIDRFSTALGWSSLMLMSLNTLNFMDIMFLPEV